MNKPKEQPKEYRYFYWKKDYDGGWILTGMGCIVFAVFLLIEAMVAQYVFYTPSYMTLFSVLAGIIFGAIGFSLVGSTLDNPENIKVYLKRELVKH